MVLAHTILYKDLIQIPPNFRQKFVKTILRNKGFDCSNEGMKRITRLQVENGYFYQQIKK
jgi:hypothetical protein